MSFEKLNAIDELLHSGPLPFAELVGLASAKLESALRSLRERLSPTRPIVVCGDHGLRIRADGRGYQHGGGSTLERLVPVLHLSPRQR